MTGDGVNDLLALREADCSIAIASGSDAARQISQVVLLDSDFTYLPQVVLEGRKVVNNVTRTAAVFFIKTIYSVLVSFFCLALNVPFPFIPIQITLGRCLHRGVAVVPDDIRIGHATHPRPVPAHCARQGGAVRDRRHRMIIAFSLIAPFGETQNRTGHVRAAGRRVDGRRDQELRAVHEDPRVRLRDDGAGCPVRAAHSCRTCSKWLR